MQWPAVYPNRPLFFSHRGLPAVLTDSTGTGGARRAPRCFGQVRKAAASIYRPMTLRL
ncbi:hypothetical protein PCL1606_08600 [Pseudomonas chlororaphis]|uniref:Uncharacterized protein n=1 Tax=Pseudomonas chlororaphis TaxID=587753 RepID=A0A0D5XU06_9PSED|nr:hypothetical protein PCL1606_08600 [Pseudomonas chlororaphis]